MTAERYTAVFTGLLSVRKPGEYLYMTMSRDPLGVEGSYALQCGKPPRESLGREIEVQDLPEGCRGLVLDAYRELWDL